ncbi:hypothetical protein DKT68_12415 [Micromonospora acroterricola]|uniref:Uncharacterized protein n=1 Tax=Micromonospora acroterricola TaxID=2202421 RepID=A0A317D5E3_9ACTN|nr:hypothetical protein [Micromonospora acroterricola]PWR09360.1 hypothetical protein DKT68_12415 [Micromonospora acroterricola]
MALLLPVTGCSQPAAGPPADLAAAESDQPFSLFLGDELGQIDYAQMKVRNKCLAEAGYPQNLNVMLGQPRNPFRHLRITEASFGPTSEAEATRIGFGRDSLPAPSAVVSFDPSYDRAYDRCTDTAWRALFKDGKQLYYNYFDLGNKLSEPLMPMVNDRMDPASWRGLLSCLVGKGHRPKDEAAFLKAPTPALFDVPVGTDAGAGENAWQPKGVPGTIEVGPAVPAREYRAGPAESRVALAWFQCRRDTGVARQQVEIAVQVQRELVAKHESSFIELNPQITQLAKQSVKLIGAA